MADWEYVEQCAQLASPTPVIGNGDILSYEDYVAAKVINRIVNFTPRKNCKKYVC